MLLVWFNCSTINILSAVVNCTMTAPIMTWSILLYFGVGYAWLNSTRHTSLNCIALRMLSFYECSNLCKSRSRVPTLKLTSVTQFTRYSIKICYSHYQYPLAYTHVLHKAGTLLAMKWLRGKLSDTILLTLPVQLLWDDIDQLSRDGFHWIIQKVIFKVGKVRFSPFSHNYWYYSIVTKCCPNLLHHVAFLFWNQSCPKIWKVWNHSKGHFQGQKGPIWTFVIYFS